MIDLTVSHWLPEAAWEQWQIKRLFCRHTALLHGSDWWMSDLPCDLAGEFELFAKVEGRVLITGLGLGIVPAHLATLPQVESIDVIEIDAGIIKHVGIPLIKHAGSKVRIHHADALTFCSDGSSKWDWAWHDIWLKPTEEVVDRIEIHYIPMTCNQLSWWPRPPRKY